MVTREQAGWRMIWIELKEEGMASKPHGDVLCDPNQLVVTMMQMTSQH